MTENKNAKTPTDDGHVAWGCQCGRAYTVTCISSKPAKQWVGLTDEEIKQLWKDTPQLVGVYSYTDISREVEAKLKEKNT